MKISLVSLAALAALMCAPIASQASDKEVVRGHLVHHKQVALAGHAMNEDRTPRMITVTQTGQGQAITFFAGDR